MARTHTFLLAALLAVLLQSVSPVAAAEAESTPNPCPRNDKCAIWTYYVAAEEVEWDYAPSGKDGFSGDSLTTAGSDPAVFAAQAEGRIGKKYLKAVYKQYTDDKFEKQVARRAEDEHLGIMGPVLRAEVNQVIRVVFKNKAKTNPYSIHPHGVFYDKDNEGAGMGPDAGAGASVDPGKTFTYTWPVPNRAGPGPNDGSAMVWAYHSHVMESDIYDGLYGALVVYESGILGDNGLPKYDSSSFRVKKEFFLSFVVGNENESSFLKANIAKYAKNTTYTPEEFAALPATIKSNTTALAALDTSDAFKESNMMHNINGYFYGNLPTLQMDLGDYVRFYLLAFGTEVDIHTIHWHGITVMSEGHRRDVLEAFPATFRWADAHVDNPGNWLLHCHVHDHFKAGMYMSFNVSNPKEVKTLNDMMAATAAPSALGSRSILAAAGAAALAVFALVA
ncbi:hypothetical protein H9P43_001883 [Blastocladiella emersonii ATCC 22665]|nr:hypothetical protein H9P43_001883 [Blastocladiella emersonii ATCC 22665]